MLSLVAVLVAALALAGGCSNDPPVPSFDVGKALALPTTTGAAFDPATLRGKPTLVMFASPTCGYCAAELPIAQAAAAAEDANVVAVYIVGTRQAAAAVVERAKFTQPALVDEAGTLRGQLDISAVPYLLVLGPDGRARKAYRGQQDEGTLRSALASAR